MMTISGDELLEVCVFDEGCYAGITVRFKDGHGECWRSILANDVDGRLTPVFEKRFYERFSDHRDNLSSQPCVHIPTDKISFIDISEDLSAQTIRATFKPGAEWTQAMWVATARFSECEGLVPVVSLRHVTSEYVVAPKG